MKTILALDTATEALSVALQHNGETLSHFELAPRLHAQKLLGLIDELLSAHNLKVSDVDAFVFGRGPGAFTGVRTAVGVVQGLAFAYGKPVLGISTLEAMAQAAFRETGATHVITAIDARMGEVYWAAWQKSAKGWQVVVNECVCPPDKVQWPAVLANGERWLGVGTGWMAYSDALKSDHDLVDVRANADANPIALYPNALDMLTLARPRLDKGEGVAAHQAEPVYLRDQVAHKPKPKQN